jgi:ATP-binding cassette subfamily B protein
MQKFFVPLNDLSLKYTVLQNAAVAAERIFALRDEDDVTAEPPVPVRLAAVRGRLDFEDVTFGYDASRPVLRGLDLRIEPGERVAIVGATGAGKTTILSLLTRLYDVQGGRILLDGVDIRELATADLRRHVGIVPQDGFLFEGDVLDNVRRGRPGASEREARAVADELHLGEVVARFPGGYREPVRERGVNLSAGERQLVAFARVMLASPEVLVLDEATSSVDSHTEHLLQEATHRLTEGRTSLVIAHRLSTVRDADRIVVLHRAEVVEQGSHDELMAASGRYRQLYELQFDDSWPSPDDA